MFKVSACPNLFCSRFCSLFLYTENFQSNVSLVTARLSSLWEYSHFLIKPSFLVVSSSENFYHSYAKCLLHDARADQKSSYKPKGL
jgi:hypothetical protein